MTDEQAEKLAAALYEQGLIMGLGLRDGLMGPEKQASIRDDMRSRFGLKTAEDLNVGGAGPATPTAPPATPSNDSEEKKTTSDVVKDNDPNLPESELAQGSVGEAKAAFAKRIVKDVGAKGMKALRANSTVTGAKGGVIKKAPAAPSFGAQAVQKTKDFISKNPLATVGGTAVGAGALGYVAAPNKTASTNPFLDAVL